MKVITDAQGRMRTVGETPESERVTERVSKEKLERTRRELRDMLSGNAQFHDDPNAAPKPEDPLDLNNYAGLYSPKRQVWPHACKLTIFNDKGVVLAEGHMTEDQVRKLFPKPDPLES